MTVLKNITVKEDTSLKNILLKIDTNGKNGVFVVRSNKLVGVITDSDIRKKLLENNLNNKTRAKDLMEKNFLFIPFKKKTR